jgi:Amt family ammonium transporter
LLTLPADFIALAEESGLILSLGRWVLTAACRQARQWEVRHGDHSVSMSVNVSVRQLQQATFVEEVAEVLGETGADPSRIVLEVTESVMMQDVDATIPVLKRLKSLGVRLAIDDFGTGYSSLSYLTLYPFDILKIDKSFIDGIDRPGNQLELTRAIIELAKVLGLEIVAEGIEREEQALQLRNLNCDVVQGFLFSRSLPAEAIAEMIDRAWHDLAA